MELTLRRNVRLNGKWESIGLSQDERKQIERFVQERNLAVMRECVDDCLRLAPMATEHTRVRIAVALFDKRATSFFAASKEFLDAKIEELRAAAKQQGNG